jgi:hypothetical protein
MPLSLQKRNYIRSKKILASANGEQCTIQSPYCNGSIETTVACHSILYEDGKGRGIKAEDIYIAYGCSACHDFIDGRNSEGYSYLETKQFFHRGMKRTWKRLIEKGIIKIV